MTLRRYARIRPRRSRPRRGEPTAAEKATLRLRVYQRARGRCELHLLPDCIKGVLPYEGDVFERGHLAHLHSRGAGGEWNEENTRWSCWRCHLIGIHTQGLKP